MKTYTFFFEKWPYDEALEWMKNAKESLKKEPSGVIIGCGSHEDKVITLGRNCEINFYNNLKENSYIIRRIDRGGGITAHEPGQLVLYPVFNISHLQITIPRLITLMETTMIDFLKEIGISAHRSHIGPGVYVGEKKIGFVGLRISDGITQHGISLNLLNDAKIFSYFDPCGIKGLSITSAQYHVELKRPIINYIKMLTRNFLRLLSSSLVT